MRKPCSHTRQPITFSVSGLKTERVSTMRGPRAVARLDPTTTAAAGSVAEEAARDHVGDREVFALPSERAQLDREHDSDLVGMPADVIAARATAAAPATQAEAEHRDALDVRAETHPVGEARVERRRGEAGDRREEESRRRPRRPGSARFERLAHRALAELDRAADPRVVEVAEVRELLVLVDRQCEVPASTPAFAVKHVEASHDVGGAQAQIALESRGDGRLVVVVLGQRDAR
jgi:hypothetical protein